MQPATPATVIPGTRISNYRNSAPRAIALVGLGATASELVDRLARRGLPNVATATATRAIDWNHAVGDAAGRRPDMIVIVCGSGDAELFRPGPHRPTILVTFVLLQCGNEALRQDTFSPDAARARTHCDLFVTTSDPDYVAELIDNLAS